MTIRAIIAGLILAAAPGCQSQPRETAADLVLRGGRIVTVDDKVPEAQALAASGGKIVAVTTDADIARYIGPSTQVIDLGGKLAIPGFIEGHGHFTGIGQNRINLDLITTTSWDEIVRMVADAAAKAKPGEWIIGRGWHQSKWTAPPQPNVEGFPLHASLDKVSPNNPVALTHAS
jgi:predicted amidohydrolase YtcJ